jgi:hypothetical protein
MPEANIRGKMFKNPKRAFWEALLVTTAVFVFGLFLGASFEANRVDNINQYYLKSETSVMDLMALNDITNINDSDCERLISSSFEFADKIYKEAIILDNYENSAKMNENLKLLHYKYDIMKILLWSNILKIREKCNEEPQIVIYLFEYETEDLEKKARQKVWSKILDEIKQEKGDDFLLLPLAGNIDFTSLNYLKQEFGITELPAVVVNGKVITELESKENISSYLN